MRHATMLPAHDNSVLRAAACRLAVGPGDWDFALSRRADIEAHWERCVADGARHFNGAIHLMRSHVLADGVLTARFVATDFKSYLYWRETGFPDRSVTDAFGSALVRSAEGHVLLGRQREGHVNAGLTYLPGGFIDPRDIGAAGDIDIEASIVRELREETGLAAAALARVPGFILTFAGPLMSIAVELRAPLSAEALRECVREHLAADPDAELADVIVVRSAADLAGLSMPDYASMLLQHVLGAE